jgi:hypothetical protein
MSAARLVTSRRWLGRLAPSLAVIVPIFALTVPSVADAATVYTLEGGLVGVIPGANFTAGQLRGDHCKAPNTCQNLPYVALPDGGLVDQGAASLHSAIIGSDGDVLAVGHSEGGQVIYELLRDYDADPSSGPDPAKFSWISIGNPENKFGGVPWSGYNSERGLPEDTAYTGTEVIRQYDGWADWPDDSSNLLAVANAVVGMQTIHTDYNDVDITSPNNVTYHEGNVTYVWVPTDTLPLVGWTGPFAPALDNALRPTVESAYDRPVSIADPTPPSVQTAAFAAPEISPAGRKSNLSGTDSPALRQPNVRNSVKAIPGDGADWSQQRPHEASGESVRGGHRIATLTSVAKSIKSTVRAAARIGGRGGSDQKPDATYRIRHEHEPGRR